MCVGGRSPWSPGIFAVEPGAQSLSLVGARTKIMILAKWSPGVQSWSPRATIFLSLSPVQSQQNCNKFPENRSGNRRYFNGRSEI